MSYGKHPYFQTHRERDAEAFRDECDEFVRSGTRKVPQFGSADGIRRKERQVLGSYQAWHP